MVASQPGPHAVTLFDAVRADLRRATPDALLPPLRRDQGLAVVDVLEVAPVRDDLAAGTLRLDDGREAIVPLTRDAGRWRRAEAEDAVSMAFLDAPPPLTVDLLEEIDARGQHRERAIAGDMSNDARVIDDAVVVKWQFLRETGSLAGPRLVAHLREAGFDEMPAPLATISWDGELIASYARLLPQASDGWGWMLEDVRASLVGDGPAPEWAGPLGSLTGRMHAACATATATVPTPLTRGGMAALARHYRTLTQVELDDEMSAALGPWLERFEDAIRTLESTTTTLMPIHGDVHAGQFLRWREGVSISDFDGNPLLPAAERGAPGPPALDVAGLLRTLDHVAIAAARRTGDADCLRPARHWAREARDAALQGYLSVTGVPPLDMGVLAALEALSPLHEAVYAATYLPRWRYVPLTVLTGA